MVPVLLIGRHFGHCIEFGNYYAVDSCLQKNVFLLSEVRRNVVGTRTRTLTKCETMLHFLSIALFSATKTLHWEADTRFDYCPLLALSPSPGPSRQSPWRRFALLLQQRSTSSLYSPQYPILHFLTAGTG